MPRVRAADEETNQIDANQGCGPAPANSKSSIDDVVPAEMQNEAGGDSKPHEQGDDHARFHAKSPSGRRPIMPRLLQLTLSASDRALCSAVENRAM